MGTNPCAVFHSSSCSKRAASRPLPSMIPTSAPKASPIRYSAEAICPPLMPSSLTSFGKMPEAIRSTQFCNGSRIAAVYSDIHWVLGNIAQRSDAPGMGSLDVAHKAADACSSSTRDNSSLKVLEC